jgi:outer membrane protein assembly factor BamC
MTGFSRIAFAAFLAATVGGCGGGLLESQRIEYKSAGKLPPLEIPPDLTAPNRDDRFAVPDVTPSSSATLSTYNAERGGASRATTSTRSELLPVVSQVRIERSGDTRWLVVPEPPEKVWPVVKGFWQEMGLLVKVEQPEVGIMETDWAENRANLPLDFVRRNLGSLLDTLYSTGELDKYRTRLERGAQPGTTEIYISHRGAEEVYTNANPTGTGDRTTRWQPRATDPGLEAEFLTRLMTRFGVEETKARAQVGEPAAERAKIASTTEGAVLLYLDEPFDRAWRRVGLALDRVGFTVEDRDRTKGFYYVRYVDPDADAIERAKKNEGFFSRLFSSKQDLKPEQYRVVVRDNRETSQVQVLNKEGGADASDNAKRILALLHQQLK